MNQQDQPRAATESSVERTAEVWKALKEVRDPEIPVLSLVDLNIVRSVEVTEGCVKVEMVPTFAGCPALNIMRDEVVSKLRSLGFEHVEVEFTLHRRWSTDDLSEEALEKLRTFGIAPPVHLMSPEAGSHLERLQRAVAQPVLCPFCGSTETKLDAFFGSTLCKQLYFCTSCQQSFDRFKPV
jgi:ring-1,2-phenylacetyl-CoA epoxidase subunit PaaD